MNKVGDIILKRISDNTSKTYHKNEITTNLYGLLFSGNWCPDCHNWIPSLKDVYNEINGLDEDEEVRGLNKLEIVWVSNDFTMEEYSEYLNSGEHGRWLTIPNQEVCNRLKGAWGVWGMREQEVLNFPLEVKRSGIPALLIFDKDHHLVSYNGKEDLDKWGENAYDKWMNIIQKKNEKKIEMFEKLKTIHLMRVLNGSVRSATFPSSRLIGLYFSGHWCGPCRAFTPALSDFYHAVNDLDKDEEDDLEDERVLEIIWISSDFQRDEFDEYVAMNAHGRWLAVDYEDTETRSDIKRAFGICGRAELESLNMSSDDRLNGIPTLVIINPTTGEIIDGDARNLINSKGENAINDWLALLDNSSNDQEETKNEN